MSLCCAFFVVSDWVSLFDQNSADSAQSLRARGDVWDQSRGPDRHLSERTCDMCARQSAALLLRHSKS